MTAADADAGVLKMNILTILASTVIDLRVDTPWLKNDWRPFDRSKSPCVRRCRRVTAAVGIPRIRCGCRCETDRRRISVVTRVTQPLL